MGLFVLLNKSLKHLHILSYRKPYQSSCVLQPVDSVKTAFAAVFGGWFTDMF